jgi:crotonobetainyl-CoA:carnitine CoA-transferase CaiB-like acyl-CoA transferase
VVDLSTGIAGPYCAKLLAQFGARVVKIEPPTGDESRLLGPFLDGVVDAERSATFLHLNAGKEGMVVDLTTPVGAAAARRLITRADMVVTSQTPDEMTALGLTPDDLLAANPALVITMVTPFGATGPYRGYRATEITLAAMGGPMNSRGSEDRPPIKLAGNVVQYECGNVALVGTLAAHLQALDTGAGQIVDVSNLETQEGSIDTRLSYLLGYQYTGLITTRPPRPATPTRPMFPGGFYRAGDGRSVQIATLGNHLPKMLAALGNEELTAAMKVKGAVFRPEVQAQMDETLRQWLAARTARQAMRDAQAHGWPVMVVNSTEEVLHDEHESTRGFWIDVDYPDGETVTHLGPPWRLTAEPPGPVAPAPALGRDTRAVLTSFGWSGAEIADLFDSGVVA